MTSTQQPYVSCIRSFGKPILPPLMTEEKRRLMRNFKAMACEREARREKRKEAFRNENVLRGAEYSPKGSSLATAVHKELEATPVVMSGVILSKGFRWVPSPSGSTPDTTSSATLVPTSSESDPDDPHDKTFDSSDVLSGGDGVSSGCAEVSVADGHQPVTQPVADDEEASGTDETSRPPLLRSLSFTVDKPSLALLLWGSRSHHAPQAADGTDKPFSPTATPQKMESNDSLSGASPTLTDLSSSQPSLASSKADGEDSAADGNVDGGPDDVFADADAHIEADEGLPCSDFEVASDGPQPSDVKTTSETFVVCNNVKNELSTSTATRGVVLLKRGETFLRSPRRKDDGLSKSAGGDRRSFASMGSVESSAAESSALSTSQLSSSNDAEQRQDGDDADQDSDIETSSDSSDDSFRYRIPLLCKTRNTTKWWKNNMKSS